MHLFYELLSYSSIQVMIRHMKTETLATMMSIKQDIAAQQTKMRSMQEEIESQNTVIAAQREKIESQNTTMAALQKRMASVEKEIYE